MDPRLNHRAPRGRDGRASDHLEPARWHMRIWREWKQEPKPNPWPPESSEVRALASRQAQTRRDGVARWTRRTEAPPMPKESPPVVGSREPRIDRRRIGPMVDRLLADFVAEGGALWVAVLVAEYTEQGPQGVRAASLGLSPRAYKYRLREALNWLAGRLLWVSLEQQQTERKEA